MFVKDSAPIDLGLCVSPAGGQGSQVTTQLSPTGTNPFSALIPHPSGEHRGLSPPAGGQATADDTLLEAPDGTNLLSPELCGPGPTPCSLPNTLVGDAPTSSYHQEAPWGQRWHLMHLAPPKSSPRPRLQLASLRIYKLAVASSSLLMCGWQLTPPITAPFTQLMPRAARLTPMSNTVFPPLSQLTTFHVSNILLKACPQQDVSCPWRGRGEGRETYQDLPWHCTEFSQQPWEGHTKVIPILQLRKLRLREARHPVTEPVKGWLSSCSPRGHDSAGSLTLTLVRTPGLDLCFIC